MRSVLSSLSLGSLLAFVVPTVIAGFSPSSNTNIAIYWGQNSNGQANSQQRLSYYCQNSELDIIPLAFLTSIANPAVNFASATNDCTAISGSNLVSCPEIASDIVTCQQTYGKTILLSVGGATYSEGGFSSSSDAVAAANNLWAIFGPPTSSSAPRPFGDSVIDGFDLDFESTFSNGPAFANQLRSNMNSDTSKPYYLTAAPQCPYPDSADGPMLAGAVSFDAVFVQFYNNYCQTTSYTAGSSSQNNFDFSTWDNWAKTVSLNPNVKVFLGIPGSSTAAGSGYESASALADVISYSKSFSSFGGLMIWDASQVWANTGFLDGVNSDLGNAAATTFATVTMRSTTITSSPGTSTSSGAQPTQSTVAEYDQCGGQGYTGSTICASPYVCIYHSTYYSECQVAGSSPDITRPGNNATHVRLLRPAPVVN